MPRQRRQKVVRRITCARCDTHLGDPSRRIYSRFTRNHFCADLNGCARRAARKAKSVARATA